MKRLCTAMGGVVLLAVLYAIPIWLGVTASQAQDKKPQPKVTPKSVDLFPQPGKANVVEKKHTELTKFKSPITTVPGTKPPPRTGGDWHWHRWHGWVWLPASAGVRVTLLPETFVLPQTVVYYEQASAPIEVVCPHCGQTITVYVR